jgi:hypothetical protein
LFKSINVAAGGARREEWSAMQISRRAGRSVEEGSSGSGAWRRRREGLRRHCEGDARRCCARDCSIFHEDDGISFHWKEGAKFIWFCCAVLDIADILPDIALTAYRIGSDPPSPAAKASLLLGLLYS